MFAVYAISFGLVLLSNNDIQEAQLNPASKNHIIILNYWITSNFQSKISTADENFLYVIVPYFNFAKYKRRKELFIKFIDYMCTSFSRTIRVLTIEATLANDSFELPNINKEGNCVILHYKHRLENLFWCKENIINFASRFRLLISRLIRIMI